MEKIVKEYGNTILEIVCMVLFIGILLTRVSDGQGHQGIFEIVGAYEHQESEDYSTYQDYQVFEREGAKEAPAITYAVSGQMKATANRLSDFLTVVDYNGQPVSYKITKISDWRGNEVADAYDRAAQTITFPAIRIKAVDGANRKSIVDIRVPVTKN